MLADVWSMLCGGFVLVAVRWIGSRFIVLQYYSTLLTKPCGPLLRDRAHGWALEKTLNILVEHRLKTVQMPVDKEHEIQAPTFFCFTAHIIRIAITPAGSPLWRDAVLPGTKQEAGGIDSVHAPNRHDTTMQGRVAK